MRRIENTHYYGRFGSPDTIRLQREWAMFEMIVNRLTVMSIVLRKKFGLELLIGADGEIPLPITKNPKTRK